MEVERRTTKMWKKKRRRRKEKRRRRWRRNRRRGCGGGSGGIGVHCDGGVFLPSYSFHLTFVEQLVNRRVVTQMDSLVEGKFLDGLESLLGAFCQATLGRSVDGMPPPSIYVQCSTTGCSLVK